MNQQIQHFYARQHICFSAYMPWQFRLSVRPSVRLSVTRVDQSKTAEASITQFSPYREGGKISHILALSVNI